jgi:PAS domain S-box-containing protein
MTGPRSPEADLAAGDVTSDRLRAHDFRALIEVMPDAIGVYESDRVLYANPAMVELLGYERADEVVGMPAIEVVFPEDRAFVVARMRAFGERGKHAPPPEERFCHRDGSPVPVEVSTRAIVFDGVPATLVHARDLTERKHLEAQVVMGDRLASVGRLAAAVGHEINNPLAYVLANVDLALERLAEPDAGAPARLAEIVEMLTEAREGANRVRHIVRDLKVFSRGETEAKSRIDPRRVLDSCLNLARGEIRQRAEVVRRYEETAPVLANEARLGQVLLNLLVNAAHAIPEDDDRPHRIEVGTRSDAEGRVVIEVSDNGVGMREELRSRIFEPFFTTKTAGRGSGLGLSIARSIVVALGGSISVESEVGHGSTFRVVLPAAPREP